jgi:hypothetical protein
MMELRVLVEVTAGKRQEFLQAMKSFLEMSASVGEEQFVYRRMDSDNMYCLMLERESREEIETFMESSRFQFFSGAADVLGEILEARVVEASEVNPLR